MNGRQYQVGTILGGHIRILDGPTLAVKGKIILHGIQLEYVSEALRPFAAEIAFGVALKVAAMQPYPSLSFP